MLKRLGKYLVDERKDDLNDDLNEVIYWNGSIYWLLRKYNKQSREKQVRYKIIGIKRRINDINLIRNDLTEIFLN